MDDFTWYAVFAVIVGVISAIRVFHTAEEWRGEGRLNTTPPENSERVLRAVVGLVLGTVIAPLAAGILALMWLDGLPNYSERKERVAALEKLERDPMNSAVGRVSPPAGDPLWGCTGTIVTTTTTEEEE